RERLNREADAAASKSLDEARRRLEEEARRSAEAFRETAATVANRVLDEQLAGVAPMLDTLVASSAGRVKDVIDKKVEELEPEFKAASGGAVEKVAASYLERASQAVDEKVGAALNRLHVTLDEALGKRLEEIRREGSRVASEFKAASAQAGEESAKALAKQSADAVAPVTAATDAGRGKLQATVKDLEGDLEGKMTDFRRQMGDSSGVALDGFRNYLGDIARSFEEQLEISARDHQARAAEQTAGDMKKFAADTLDVVKAQCQKQADDFLELFDHQLSTTAQKHVEQVRTQMSELGHSAAEQLQKDSQAREAERALLEAHAKKVLEETSRQLSGVAEGTASSLRQAVREATEGYRDQLHRTLDESVARSTEDLDNYFTNVLEGRRGAVVAEIHKQADEAGARAVAEVKGRAETAAAEMKGRAEAAAKDATDQVLRQVGLATMVLKDWGDQATSRLEGTFQKSLETFKMRIEMIASSAAEDQRKRSTKTTSELLQRLKQAAQALETPSE
ncbi:MAG: hypothetical protein DMG21_00085, partial [Acidobacteria bacterium]